MNIPMKEASARTAILSHELRTPLNAIIGFSDLIVEEDSLKDIRIFADIIRESGLELLDKLLKIIDADFLFGDSKLEVSKVDFEILFSKINNTITTDSPYKDVLPVYSISEKALTEHLSSDINRLEKILSSIIRCLLTAHNSSKLCCNVYFDSSEDNQSSFIFGATVDTPLSRDYCRLCVSNIQSNENNDYYSYCDGLGIDLAVCQFLVDQLNGRLFIESTSEKTNFVLTVPQNINIYND